MSVQEAIMDSDISTRKVKFIELLIHIATFVGLNPLRANFF